MKIKAYVGMDEYNKVRYYKNFEVVEEIPEVGEDFGYHFGDGVIETVKDVQKLSLDPEQGSVDVYDYDFYKITTDWKEDDETTEECYYYAIKKEEQ